MKWHAETKNDEKTEGGDLV